MASDPYYCNNAEIIILMIIIIITIIIIYTCLHIINFESVRNNNTECYMYYTCTECYMYYTCTVMLHVLYMYSNVTCTIHVQ